MRRIIRLIDEALFALFFYKNFYKYWLLRLGFFSGKKSLIKLWNGINYKINGNAGEIGILNEIWNMNIYDPLLKFVKDDSVIVDIGANIGVFSIKAAQAGSCAKVFGYEPMPKNFELLKENISLNNLKDRDNDSGGASMYVFGNKEGLKSIKVKSTTLLDIFRINKIEKCDFLKIDCEGAEEDILFNAPRELFNKINSMTIEWHGGLNNLRFHNFVKFLNNLRYETKFHESTLTLYVERK